MTYSTIQIKYSLVTAVPTSLAQGELAYSQLSGKLYIGNDQGTPVEIGGADLVSRVGSVEVAVGLLQTEIAAIQAVNSTQTTDITDLQTANATQDASIAALQAAVAALEASQDADLANAIAALQDADLALQTALASETNARTAADEALDDKIDAEIARATAAEASLQTSIDSAVTTINTAITDIQTDISSLEAADVQLASEVSALDNRLDTLEGAVQVGSGGNVTISDLTVTGDLVVQGTLTRVDSTVETIDDPVITIGAGTAAVNDAMDRGIEYKWFDPASGTVKTGFFGVDNTDGKFKFIPDATSGGDNIFNGQVGDVKFGGIEATSFSVSNGIKGVSVAAGTNTIVFEGADGGIVGNGTNSTIVGFVISGGTF